MGFCLGLLEGRIFAGESISGLCLHGRGETDSGPRSRCGLREKPPFKFDRTSKKYNVPFFPPPNQKRSLNSLRPYLERTLQQRVRALPDCTFVPHFNIVKLLIDRQE